MLEESCVLCSKLFQLEEGPILVPQLDPGPADPNFTAYVSAEVVSGLAPPLPLKVPGWISRKDPE